VGEESSAGVYARRRYRRRAHRHPRLRRRNDDDREDRLAEDYATAEILTGGRVIFGVGRSYHTREVETFGAPMLDAEANRELFEEQVEIIFKAFNEESFAHHGKHYTLPPAVPYRGYELRELT
jgi:hypothetical protein